MGACQRTYSEQMMAYYDSLGALRMAEAALSAALGR